MARVDSWMLPRRPYALGDGVACQTVGSESACPRGRENRAGQGRRAKPMLDCMGEPEDADPAKVRSVSRGCEEFGINRLVANLANRILDLLDDEVAELLAVGELVSPHGGHH